MPSLVLKYECSRCPTVTEVAVTPEQIAANGIGKAKKPAVEIFMDGEKIRSYDELCPACKEIISSYVMKAMRNTEVRASLRPRKPKAVEPRKPAKEKGP